MDERVSALENYRQISILYTEKKIAWEEFWENFPKIMMLFDPLEDNIDGLSKIQKKEASFYFEWHGGEFEENENKIPKLENWRYGESMEPYEWIDKKAYFVEFKSAFNDLRNEIGI